MINIIAAVAENNVIGKDGKMPWHLPADLRNFRKITKGKTIVMGRKTYESLKNMLAKKGKNRKTLASGRKTIILSRNPDFDPPKNALHFDSIKDVLDFSKDNEIFIVGGGNIYKQFLPYANKLYITRVHTDIKGDTYFPEIDPNRWNLISSKHRPADHKHKFAFTKEIYIKASSNL
ncbi:dihydrofolate reductase [Candidatus Dojkabacteria bacterium]|nr:dihydrofolate reductase [Candidatus Dojkabacteria bacterium]